MNKLFFMRNPELFQGEKYLSKNKNYFEGWYFKNSNGKESISFIPGINMDDTEKNAFIQVITKHASYFINYPIEEFKFNFNPFEIKIGKNIFSKEGIHIEIKENVQKLTIKGDIRYFDLKNINKNLLAPNIMGPFSYIPFMECNHAIISMAHNVSGEMEMNGEKIEFSKGKGYIEKDWGCSFPKTYIWCQGNEFERRNASFMLSIANIPFKIFEFQGLICDFIMDDLELKFATYNNAKLIKKEISDHSFHVILKKGKHELDVKSTNDRGLRLSAPVKGKMEKDILESLSAPIWVTLKENNQVIFSDRSENCGLEMV